MKIKSIRIENFRSIEKAEIFPSDVCALVGENNAGKTNVLSALDFLLGEVYPSRNRLDTSHYYHGDTSKPIFIEVAFEPNERNIERVWCDMPWEERGGAWVEFSGSREYRLSNNIREHCALVYLDAGRSLEYHLGQGRYTLFGRITRLLYEDFKERYEGSKDETLESIFGQAEEILRTPIFSSFENELKNTFGQQLSRTAHDIDMEFRAFEPTNYYRSMRPVLVEDGVTKHPRDVGQGMRNLVVLSLFRAYAKVFKGDAIIAIEEPETYLHPHAQRSLATIFDELAEQGNQIFYSTHSGNFVDVSRFDRICLTNRCSDGYEQFCTEIRQVPEDTLLNLRQDLHPEIAEKMTIESLRERYRKFYDLEHNEAFFARKIVLVEGESEENALPIYARHLGYDFDASGVSIVKARGKASLDSFYQLYEAFDIPLYLVFDNDRGGNKSELRQNETLLRMLGESEESAPEGRVHKNYAVLEGNFEKQMQNSLDSEFGTGYYEEIQEAAATELGGGAGKDMQARFVAQTLVERDTVPTFVEEIVEAIRSLDDADSGGTIHVENPFEDFFDDVPF